MNISEFRQRYPQYDDLSDQELGNRLYAKFYEGLVPRDNFDLKFYGPTAEPEYQSPLAAGVSEAVRRIPSAAHEVVAAPVRGGVGTVEGAALIGRDIPGIKSVASGLGALRSSGLLNQYEHDSAVTRLTSGSLEAIGGMAIPGGIASKATTAMGKMALYAAAYAPTEFGYNYDHARRRGTSAGRSATEATAITALSSALESFSASRLLGRLMPDQANRMARDYVRSNWDKVKSIADSSTTEAGTEYAQNLVSGFFREYVGKEEGALGEAARSIDEPAIGAIVGGIFGVAGEARPRAPQQSQEPVTAPVTPTEPGGVEPVIQPEGDPRVPVEPEVEAEPSATQEYEGVDVQAWVTENLEQAEGLLDSKQGAQSFRNFGLPPGTKESRQQFIDTIEPLVRERQRDPEVIDARLQQDPQYYFSDEDVRAYNDAIKETRALKNEQVDEYNQARAYLQDQFASNRGASTRAIKSYEDPSQIPGFDDLVQTVRDDPALEAALTQFVPQFSSTEDLVFQALKAPKQERFKNASPEVIQEVDAVFEGYQGENMPGYEPAMASSDVDDAAFSPAQPKQDLSLEQREKPKAPVRYTDVLTNLEAVISRAGSQAKLKTKGRLTPEAKGMFKPFQDYIRLGVGNDIPTAIHEAAHAVDWAINEQTGPAKITKEGWPDAKIGAPAGAELDAKGRELYKGKGKPKFGYRREGFAEFVRMWMIDPDAAAREMPNTLDYFEGPFVKEAPQVYRKMQEAALAVRSWSSQGALNRAMASQISTPITMKKHINKLRKLTPSDLQQAIFEQGEQLRRIRDLSNSIGPKLEPDADPYEVMMALRMTSNSIMTHMLERGGLDADGNTTTAAALNDISKHVTNKESPQWMAYMHARRALALWDDKKKGPRNPGMSREDAEYIVEQLKDREGYKEATKIWDDWNEMVLDYVSGFSPVTKEIVDRIREGDVGDYAPLHRVFAEYSDNYLKLKGRRGGGGGVRQPQLSARLRGSEREIRNIVESQISTKLKMIEAAHMQRVEDKLFALVDRGGIGSYIHKVPRDRVMKAQMEYAAAANQVRRQLNDAGFEVEIIDKQTGEPQDFRKIVNQSWDTVKLFGYAEAPVGSAPIIARKEEGGRIAWYEVDPKLYEALAAGGTDATTQSVLSGVMAATNRIFKAGTVGYRASFGVITNPIRDVMTGFFNTRSKMALPLDFAYDYLATAMHTIGEVLSGGNYQSDWRKLSLRLGMEHLTPIEEGETGTKRAAELVFRDRSIKGRFLDPSNWKYLPGDAFHAWMEMVQATERIPRIAEVRTVARQLNWDLSQPLTPEVATRLLTAGKQVTTDFTAASKAVREWNKYVPFLNAAAQGVRAPVRSLMINPAHVSAVRFATMVGLGLASWLRFKDEEWFQKAKREKFYYLNVPFGDEEVIMLPLNQDSAQMSVALAVASADAIYRKDPQVLMDWLWSFIEIQTPSTPPIIEEVLEQFSNKDFFTDKPIVPRGLSERKPTEQYKDYTTQTARAAGKLLEKLPVPRAMASPLRIEHAARGLAGPGAVDAVRTAEYVLGLSERAGREKELADFPVAGRLFKRGGKRGTQPPTVNLLYEVKQRAIEIQRSVEREETSLERRKRLMLTDATSAFTALRKIRDAKKLSVKESRAITARMEQIAQDVLRETDKDNPNRSVSRSLLKKAEADLAAAGRP